jgi:hypothetical protein
MNGNNKKRSRDESPQTPTTVKKSPLSPTLKLSYNYISPNKQIKRRLAYTDIDLKGTPHTKEYERRRQADDPSTAVRGNTPTKSLQYEYDENKNSKGGYRKRVSRKVSRKVKTTRKRRKGIRKSSSLKRTNKIISKILKDMQMRKCNC